MSMEIVRFTRSLKCELASVINREQGYQMIIKEKSESIRQLEKQVTDLIQSQASNTK
jgi:hypothetical protein